MLDVLELLPYLLLLNLYIFIAIVWAMAFGLCSDKIILPILGTVVIIGIGQFIVFDLSIGGYDADIILEAVMMLIRPLLLFGICRWYRKRRGKIGVGMPAYSFLGAYAVLSTVLTVCSALIKKSDSEIWNQFLMVVVRGLYIYIHLAWGDLWVTLLAMAIILGFVVCRDVTLRKALLTCTISSVIAYLPSVIYMLIFGIEVGFTGALFQSVSQFYLTVGIFAGLFWILSVGSYLLGTAFRNIRNGKRKNTQE